VVHNINVEKFGVRLRPVRLEDAEFIVRLRNSPLAAGNIGDSAPDKASQEAWLRSYFERANDLYFIVERVRDSRAVGTCGIYHIERNVGQGGRWLIEPGVPAAAASCWLSFHTCFDILGLEVVLRRAVESNKEVISFHRRIRNPCVGLSANSQVINGKRIRLVEFRTTKADWFAISTELEHYTCMAEEFL
jgi:hypothetical protein